MATDDREDKGATSVLLRIVSLAILSLRSLEETAQCLA